ncbi:MAG: hypothetical protein K2P92_08450, partial [Bdellovibrionaceae bacterium]|nr:hypothetical protein [Pseudobdellovibrionaceae bacterium]
ADRQSAKMFNNGEWVDREVPLVDGRLKRTSFGGVLFNGMQAMSIELYRNSGFTDLVADTYSYFKLLLENKTSVKDFEEFDEGTKRFVVRVTADNKLTPYDFPNGAWGRDVALPVNIVRASTAALGQTQTGLYLVGANGEIYNYKASTKAITKLASTWSPDHQEVIVYKGQNLVLLNNGQIMVSTLMGLQPWTETNETFAGLVTVPVYDGFEVVR